MSASQAHPSVAIESRSEFICPVVYSSPNGVHCVSSSLLGPVDPSFRALSGPLKITVRRHKFNEDSFFCKHPPWIRIMYEKLITKLLERRCAFRGSLQGYLAHKKQRPPRTLQQDYAEGPALVLGGRGEFL